MWSKVTLQEILLPLAKFRSNLFNGDSFLNGSRWLVSGCRATPVALSTIFPLDVCDFVWFFFLPLPPHPLLPDRLSFTSFIFVWCVIATRTCWRAAIYVGRCRSSTRWWWRPSRPLWVGRKSPHSAPCWAQTGRARLQVPTWTPAARPSRAPAPSPRATCRASSPASWAKVCIHTSVCVCVPTRCFYSNVFIG